MLVGKTSVGIGMSSNLRGKGKREKGKPEKGRG